MKPEAINRKPWSFYQTIQSLKESVVERKWDLIVEMNKVRLYLGEQARKHVYIVVGLCLLEVLHVRKAAGRSICGNKESTSHKFVLFVISGEAADQCLLDWIVSVIMFTTHCFATVISSLVNSKTLLLSGIVQCLLGFQFIILSSYCATPCCCNCNVKDHLFSRL